MSMHKSRLHARPYFQKLRFRGLSRSRQAQLNADPPRVKHEIYKKAIEFSDFFISSLYGA